jgi:hypothetical protein
LTFAGPGNVDFRYRTASQMPKCPAIAVEDGVWVTIISEDNQASISAATPFTIHDSSASIMAKQAQPCRLFLS